ncbi:type II toxin-antitoxin system VapC family toxin [Pelagerythrobacter rhizovicinus]|uniref:Ribonuclease VapC n=1 Tax=Pelagerythrobacter rhizovicinus TaxID=2268576 RepID=A0A4Q2KFZ2_9SPHN|nr:type II toxin-antitoxin system VapC family toxin [Pelagerythrobacter rhizovicinus]RXZ63925.1 type II toxin-antitoxin system VapC family toxin [Pelagerythrobacter rhizovicinus]
MIRYLIDANAAVYAMDPERHAAVTDRIARCQPGEIAMSTITFAEVVYGTKAGKPPPEHVLEAFITEIPLVPFDEAAARAYAGLPFKRARFDRLLAAHALSIGATVVTNNEADFADVPGLKLENWSMPL